MESFKIESLNKTICVNGVELVLNIDDNEFVNKIFKINNETHSDDSLFLIATNLKKLVEELFGKGICKNIFGVENPSHALLVELATNIIDETICTIHNRQLQISDKYSAEREGNV